MNLWYDVYLFLSSLKIYLFKEACHLALSTIYCYHFDLNFYPIEFIYFVVVGLRYCLLLARRHGTQGFLPQPSGLGCLVCHVELYSLCNHESLILGGADKGSCT